MKSFLEVIGLIVLIPILLIYDTFVYGFMIFKSLHWYLPVIGYPCNITYHGAIAIMLLITIYRVCVTDTTTKSVDGSEIKSEPNYPAAILLPWLILLILWGFTFIL